MFDYVKAELYRIFSKRGLYIYFGVLTVLTVALLFIFRHSFTPNDVGELIGLIEAFLALIGGGYLFGVIYNDDLTAKTLPSLIGFGRKRWFIVVAKLIITLIMITGMFVIGTGLLLGIMWLLAGGITGTSLNAGITMVVNYWLSTLGFVAVAAVVVYGTQKTTLSMITFVLMGTGFVEQLLDIPFGKIKQMTGFNLVPYKISNLSMSISSDQKYTDILPYLIVVGLFVLLAIFAFHKKDLEF